MHKVIALIDCNSFFCSCEILFNPKYRGKPVIVLSNNDGCAVSRTPEAKALGIAMGAPYFKIKEICDKYQVGVFSSNFSLYSNMSERVMKTLARFSPKMEVYSVDEAWLDLSEISPKELQQYVADIKEMVERHTGIPVSIGVAATKMLAKAANRIAKNFQSKKGIHFLLEQTAQDQDLEKIAVDDLWGIARASAVKLNALGIKNAKQFRDYKNEVLIQKILTKVGLQRKKELQGIPCFPIEQSQKKKKEIMCSRTFGLGVYDQETLSAAVAHYLSYAAEKMRAQQSLCGEITVFARTNVFKNTDQYFASKTVRLSTPSQDTFRLLQAALDLTREIYRPGFEYKKAGVRLGDFVDENQVQLNFFCETDHPKMLIINKLMDRINRIYGTSTIRSLSCGANNEAWKMLRNFKSPNFTTSWYQLPGVG